MFAYVLVMAPENWLALERVWGGDLVSEGYKLDSEKKVKL